MQQKFIKMVVSNKYSFFVLFLMLSVVVNSGCDETKGSREIQNVNAYVVNNDSNWTKSSDIDTTNCLKLKLHFLNNPYGFGSSENVLVFFDENIVYKGDFSDVVDVYIPQSLFGKRVSPGLQIFKADNEYNFIQKSSIYFDDSSKYLYVVFCPENYLIGSCYLFSQSDVML